MDGVRVEIGACRCPRTPHPDGDWVELEPRLTVPMGKAAWAAIGQAEGEPGDTELVIANVFLRYGIRRWSFVDEHGLARSITHDSINELLDWATGHEVAQKAAELYGEDLFRPFVNEIAKLLPHGPTDDSTPATTEPPTTATTSTTTSGSKRPKHSKRSSRRASDGTPSEVPAR